MDEPTNGLDIPGKSQFRKFIASGMSDDKTIVISTHQVRDIDKVLDHVLIMDDSRVLLDESTSNICDKLFFVESDDRELAKSALFAIPTIQGNYLILPNECKRSTQTTESPQSPDKSDKKKYPRRIFLIIISTSIPKISIPNQYVISWRIIRVLLFILWLIRRRILLLLSTCRIWLVMKNIILYELLKRSCRNH